MAVTDQLGEVVIGSLKALYGQDFSTSDFQINLTKPEFTGDYTIVLFSLVKKLKKSSEALGQELGTAIRQSHPRLISGFNVIKGFLNLEIGDDYWLQVLDQDYKNVDYGRKSEVGQTVMVEYSSPNTNKPLHLGHLRNNVLGWSIAAILRARGYDVVKTCIANDRGIHICKDMVAWQLYGNGATPKSTNMKGDHFVGDYYVLFGQVYKEQVAALVAGGMRE